MTNLHSRYLKCLHWTNQMMLTCKWGYPHLHVHCSKFELFSFLNLQDFISDKLGGSLPKSQGPCMFYPWKAALVQTGIGFYNCFTVTGIEFYSCFTQTKIVFCVRHTRVLQGSWWTFSSEVTSLSRGEMYQAYIGRSPQWMARQGPFTTRM